MQEGYYLEGACLCLSCSGRSPIDLEPPRSSAVQLPSTKEKKTRRGGAVYKKALNKRRKDKKKKEREDMVGGGDGDQGPVGDF